MTADLQVEAWPDRKRKVISAVEGPTSTVLATFVSDDAAAKFLELVNAKLRVAYAMGQRHAAEGVKAL
jgi:hypothetical protein